MRPNRQRLHAPGFSLIMTVSILVLLALVAVGMLTLSTLTIRSSSLSSAQAEARANARLALMLAIGELQKHAGSDQRITATAGILDEQTETAAVDGVNHPHWTGTWNSWAAGEETFGDDERSQHATLGRDPSSGAAPTYEQHREDHFRSWLVSLPEEEALSVDAAKSLSLSAVRTPGRNNDAVQLVGRGSLGEEAPNRDYVSASLLDVDTDARTGTDRTGRYAWWVADESTKARILADPYELAENLTNPDYIARAQGPGSTGHETIDVLEALNDEEMIQRIFTRDSLELAADGDRLVRQAFHDTTPFSYGVLADVREGGLKRDLNSLLERPIRLDEAGDDFMLYRIGSSRDERFPDHVPVQDLAAYYQLYRENVDYSGRRARNPLGRSVMQINNPDFTPATGFKREYTNLYRMPVPIKVQFMLSYIGSPRRPTRENRDPYKMHIGITPAVTFWNPYNVPLVLNHGPDKSTQIRFFNLPIGLRWTKSGPSGSYTSERVTSLSWITNRDRYGSGQYRSGGGDRHTGFELFVGGQKPIVFQPGEVRVFSLSKSSTVGGAAMIEDTNQWRAVREVDSGWDPNKWIELPRSDRSGTTQLAKRHVEQERLGGGNNRNDDGIGGALTFTPGDQISFSISAAENVDLANGAALQFFFRQSSVVQGNSGPSDNKWMRRQYQMISRMHNRGAAGRESQQAIDFHRELMTKAFPEQRASLEFPAINGSEIAGQTRPFLLVSLTAGCEVASGTAGDARGRRFVSRPFLHGSPIHACPFVDRDDYDSFYHHAWNWWVQDVNSVLEASVQVSDNNVNSFHGGGYTPEFGTTHIVQQEVPIAPLHSMGSLSHARLGGYSLADNALGPGAGETVVSYQPVTATGANGLFPHTLQAVGNSYAHPYLKPDEIVTQWERHYSQSAGKKNIPLVDHSYLANKALWDDYFFSSVAPHRTELFDRNERYSAEEIAERSLLDGEPFPNRRIKPYNRNFTEDTLKDYFDSGVANLEAVAELASHLMVEGPFNVNSTSVDAWRALFSSLRGKAVATLEIDEAVSRGIPIEVDSPEGVPVGATSMANGEPVRGSKADPAEPNQWYAWRDLTDGEIDELAVAMVRQVKQRGPFLSLSEFVNRRLDRRDRDLSLKGALQAALDDGDVSINKGFRNADRTFSSDELATMNPEFREALEGPIAYGSSAYVDQADILRNFGAQLTPRGDTFLIRTYGDALDPDGNVQARAWCEAVVQRVPEYLDPTEDRAHRKQDNLESPSNELFGRPFRMVSFRWLDGDGV